MEEKIQRLSEGMDFIEENTPFCNEALEFQDVSELSVSEAANGDSPYKLLGRVRGVIAPIGEYSRNHRLYESTHWSKVLSNPQLQERIIGRRCFGTLSHADKRVDDADFREGKISHICSVLEVREDDNGKPYLYGELDILDTPAGRILKAMYEGGAGLYVSTRGAGKLMPIPGDPVNKMVSSESYFFETVDFVLNPGFLQAKPVYEGIKESQEVSEQAPVAKVTINNDEFTVVNENSEIESLKTQIDKLTKIVEKVVDDVYEVETEPAEEVKEAEVQPSMEETLKSDNVQEALLDFVELMAKSNISEESFGEVIDMIVKSKENK